MMRHVLRRAAPVTTALAILATAACGAPRTLDIDESEASIRRSLARSYRLDVTAVRCPEEVEVDEGATFSCHASVQGVRVRVRVRQTDGEGRLAVEPTRAVIVTRALVADVTRVLADRFERDDARVMCGGPPVRAVAPGGVIRCSAVDGAERKRIDVRVRDVAGTLTYTLR